MKNQKIWFWSAVNALGVFAYIMIVAWLLTNGEKVFGQMNNFWGPVAFLLLFVFSALVTGLLVLGRPVYLHLNNSKKEAVMMFIYTLTVLFVITLAALLINVLIK